MIDERTEEVASLYAFDLLEGDEKREFESRLAREPGLQRLIAELRGASHAIAVMAPAAEPSPALKQRILASLPPRRQEDNIIPLRIGYWAGWAAAACFAVGAAYLGQLYLDARTETLALREREAVARLDAENARQLLEAERLLAQAQVTDLRNTRAQVARLQRQADLAQLKISTLASLLKDSPEAEAVAVWNPEAQEGILEVEKLPALPADRDYQLWVIDPQYPIPVDGGVFSVEPSAGAARLQFKPKERIETVAKFAVSLERKGGVPKAEGPMVLISP